ncbi:YchJ family protein [Pseudomarimonas arenosa]|uniref:UPF0225 protein IFO71_08510 n=1 Tax=Pseudomarimonas arenosa TaxID=2774145 RepID=A0AAW3ZJZ8_9GAMM|nr:YchJ family protein [Pseudomarimonas arenosa]MBD8525785.1 YchJ family protein [Pseudomarimonas arenosa]
MRSSEACPCGNPWPYAQCCGRYHDGEPAPNAEALMRSRYSAYVLRDADYLLATWHPTTRPDAIDFDAGVKWLGLDVKQRWQDGADRAGVEFVARYKAGGEPAQRLHEKSRFALEEGRWYYLDDELAEQR